MSEDNQITQVKFLEYLQNKKLMASKCKECKNIDLPPRQICSKCNSINVEWIDVTEQEGKLSTFSCVHVGATRFQKRGYNMKNPYAFGVVTLDNGAAITGLLEGVDPKDPTSIKIGMKMKIKFIESPIPGNEQEKQVDIGFEPV
ncbi:MAG: Zn-ribbon domain-containing OB-fold protein [Promethearchaeota archaeon]